MTTQSILSPLPTFNGLDGRPLTGGYVYIGEPNMDPRQYPANVFYDQAMTVPASQPLRTNAGYLYHNGAPTNIWVDGGAHSLMVLDENSRQVSYTPTFLGTLPAVVQATSTVDVFSGTGGQATYTLSVTPANENDTDVFVSGEYQPKGTYSVTGNQLTMTAASGSNNVEVVTRVLVDFASLSADFAQQINTAEAAAEQAVAASAVGSSGFNYRGAWATATAYAVGDVFDNAGVSYLVMVAHTSGVFATDKAANKFRFFFGHKEVWLETFGGVNDGTNAGNVNDVAMVAALSYIDAVGGGTLRMRAGTYRFDSVVTPVVSADPTPRQKPIAFIGAGGHWSGEGTGTYGSTIFDMRVVNAGGKMQFRGLGAAVVEGITFCNLGTADTSPFIMTTNTTIFVRRNAFIGGKVGTLCDQDAIVLGGTSQTIDGTSNAPFQGYGSIIEGNYFNQIRRLVYGRTYCNGVTVRSNTSWTNCGSNLAGGAAIEFHGDVDGINPGNLCVGNVISDNLIEMNNYPYGVKLTQASQNTVAWNKGYDGTATSLAMVRLESTATNTLVIGTVGPAAKPYLSEATALGLATKHFAGNDDFSQMKNVDFASTGAVNVRGTFTLKPTSTGVHGVAPTGSVTSSVLWYILSGTTDANPDAAGVRFQWKGDGSQVWGGNSAGNITNNLATGASWFNNGRKWGFNGTAGGAMEINSGTGGSPLTMQHFSIVYKSHAGVTQFTQSLGNAQGFEINDFITINDATKGRRCKTGANGRVGTATLVAGTVTVANTSVGASSIIFLSRATAGGTLGDLSYTKINGTSFTITSSSGADTSAVNYEIVETY